MRRSGIVFARTFGRLAGLSTTVFGLTAFLVVSGALFVNGLFAAEGQGVSVPSVWAVAVITALPFLASLLTMRLWSEEGDPDRLEIDLVAPVPERAFTVGRFLAAYAWVSVAVLLSLAVPVVLLPRCAPALSGGSACMGFVPALVAVLILSVPLTAIGSLAGVCLRRAAPAAIVSAAVTYALPYVAYRVGMAWSPGFRARFAEPPLQAAVADVADGFFPVGLAVAALAVAAFVLYATSKALAMRRLVGDGRLALKVSSLLAVASALLAMVLCVLLAFRLDTVVVWPGASRVAPFSERTREILSGVSQTVRVTACMRRDSAAFLPTARLLRALAAESRATAGATVECSFVDPRWDPNAMRHLGRRFGAGVGEGTVVFASDRRSLTLPVANLDESACASAIQRLSMPAKSELVLFTTGHGEPALDDPDTSGLSEIARALRQDGYRVGSFFSVTSSVPTDCAVLAIVGARTPFSEAELREIGLFISQGGRVLATVSDSATAGAMPLIERCGVTRLPVTAAARTVDGADIMVTEFGDHAVSRPLTGSVVVFAPGSVRFTWPPAKEARADGFAAVSLCGGEEALAIALEKGAGIRRDLAIRPPRLVVIGDSSFFLNGALASRANANRDFVLNAVGWLAGMDVSGSASRASDVIALQMDRASRIRFFALAVGVLPLALAGLLALLPLRKRRRR